MVVKYSPIALPDEAWVYCVDYESLEKENDRLKAKIVKMRFECNRRYSDQLQKIRKLEAEKMLQIQDALFKEDD